MIDAMAMNAAHLLKRLEPAIRPLPAPAMARKPQSGIESQSFDQLLKLAASGGVQSGRQIEVACDPQPPLQASQLERLAAAADAAEASGSKRALMMIDGRSFVLDVAARMLTDDLSGTSANAIVNVDTAIRVEPDDAFAKIPVDPAGLYGFTSGAWKRHGVAQTPHSASSAVARKISTSAQ